MAEFVGHELLHLGSESGLHDGVLVRCSGWIESFYEGIVIAECSGESGKIVVCSFDDLDRVGARPSVNVSLRTGDDGDVEAGLEQSWDDELAEGT